MIRFGILLEEDIVVNFLGHLFIKNSYGYLQCNKCNMNNVFKNDKYSNILYMLDKGISIVSLTCNEFIIKKLLE